MRVRLLEYGPIGGGRSCTRYGRSIGRPTELQLVGMAKLSLASYTQVAVVKALARCKGEYRNMYGHYEVWHARAKGWLGCKRGLVLALALVGGYSCKKR
ncbi:unnamed protein product [Dovyalis caffra]|uniref:Uncharacterized protein n=1 Tax=Dovyalis caffra TaxID=77055 RepID=A0AAV1SIV5_9ROSI|nr:unnamed protein product [Dovyalis caffra]